ncbi:hypothetical protein VYU27_001053 [Nannochloropsis oceanica]
MSQHKHNYQHHHHLHQQHHNHQNQQQHWEHQEQYQSTLPVGLIARLSALPPPPLNQQEHGQEHLTRIILTETEGSAVPPRLALPGRPQFWPRCLISYQGLRLEERRPSLFHLTGQPSANFLSIPTSRYELLATMTTDGERAMFSSHRVSHARQTSAAARSCGRGAFRSISLSVQAAAPTREGPAGRGEPQQQQQQQQQAPPPRQSTLEPNRCARTR